MRTKMAAALSCNMFGLYFISLLQYYSIKSGLTAAAQMRGSKALLAA